MKKVQFVRRALIAGLLGAVVAYAAVKIYRAHFPSMLIVGIGFPMEEVAGRSSLPVQFVKMTATANYAEYHQDMAHDLTIVDGDLTLLLPDMQTVAMQAIDGKVSLFDGRPASLTMTIDEALDWLSKTMTRVDQSRWPRSTDDYEWLYSGDVYTAYASLARLREGLLDRKLAARMRRVRVATWRHGDHMLYLDLARVPYFDTPGNMETDEVYFVTIGGSIRPRAQDP